jgi:hypothetical protein
MNVLIDYHHSDLMESLHLLFEDRLGMNVYVPYGLEWNEAAIWQFGRGYPDGGAGVARQFLLDNRPVDDLQPKRRIKRLTLDAAMDMDFDVVVATVPDNYNGYRNFAQRKHARFVIEVGNVNQYVDRSLGALILDSTGQYPGAVPFTPEYDIEGAFKYSRPSGLGGVASFVNLFPHLPCFPLYAETTALLPDWNEAVYGHEGDDFIKGPVSMGSRMVVNDFGWQDKISGDGFGYVIHYWASVGRPLIGHASHYRGQVAEDLWEDGVTAIDLDRHSPAETARLMEGDRL